MASSFVKALMGGLMCQRRMLFLLISVLLLSVATLAEPVQINRE